MAADGMEVSAGGGGGSGNKQPQISMVGLFLACMVAGGVQYGWALQLSLLTPYVQVCMQTYIYGLVHFPIPTQNIFSFTRHIKSFDACMDH
jgi:hypothetical protein